MVDRTKSYGALQLSFSNQYWFAWNDLKTNSKGKDIAFHHALIGGSFDTNRRRISQLVIHNFSNPDTQYNQLVAKDAVAGAEMLKEPVDFEWLWAEQGRRTTARSGARSPRRGTWR
ncbi:hypothetical protein [Streptomyces sp. CBMA123]|uniref:hypothetical protein n=1 Tax=Streptomyces sp. CBMA123 TaxID=1896313 RepID=UPI001661E0AD|nr:hypothetical protein [Streptomyces sp. CBMA123]MBD0695819.1 hypothetical protein [Streptomyces sp. CBMA123]